MFRRAWTCLSKVWALPFIFAGGGLLTLIGMPIMRLFSGERDSHALFLIRTSFRFYLWLLQTLRIVEIHIEDREKLAAPGGRVVIANHPSLLDVVILIATIPYPQCIVKAAFWDHRFLGGLMREAGFIRNDLEPDALLGACTASIQAGRSLIIFPEGTRTRPGEPPRFQRGFANIAMAAGSPVQPVVIRCAPPFLYKGECLWQAPCRKPIFRVSVADSLDASDPFSYGSRGLAARKLVDKLELYYAELIFEPT